MLRAVGDDGREDSVNVFGEPLEPCAHDPITGFFRDGCCNTGPRDAGSHTICTVLTEEFLQFSKDMGNDLSTPRPEHGFPGLKAGDRWCLCAGRWLQAQQHDKAPGVRLRSTHRRALEIVPLEMLREFATDLH